MATVDQERSTQTWLSPVRKLMQFFERSRNRWKAKYAAVKQRCKLMSNQVRAVEKSREKWRQEAQRARQEVLQLRRELEAHKKSAA